MKSVEDKHRLLFRQFESDASLSFLDKSQIASHRTELLRPIIAGHSAS